MASEETHPPQHEPHKTLLRIKTLLGMTTSTYTANPPLVPDDLTAWETAADVLLPEAYRLFLLEIGNGGMMPGSYCDFVVQPLTVKAVDPLVREPFPITQEQFTQRMAHLPMRGRESSSLFPELSSYWDEGLPPGCLKIGHYPSYDTVMIVVSGDLRGMIWNSVDSGLPELNSQQRPFDFLEWFEDTLLDLSQAKSS